MISFFLLELLFTFKMRKTPTNYLKEIVYYEIATN